MSTTPIPQPTPGAPERREITIVSHSTLFYWWPVWSMGFILAILTWAGGHVMAIVPHGTEVRKMPLGEGGREQETLVAPPGKMLPRDKTGEVEKPHVFVSTHKGYGVLFLTTLLLVIFITNVPLRGMWSVVIIMAIIMLSIIFQLAELWEPIIRTVSLFDIRINLFGYLLFSAALLALWLITFLFFDRQLYITFTPGQFRVCTEIGGGERVFDTMGMSVEKQRSDLFRHWILGLGSGDLVVKTSGAQNQHFDLHNVLFIGKKVQMIEDMLAKRNVIETKA